MAEISVVNFSHLIIVDRAMKILMLSTTFPYPPSRGGTQVRTFNLLKYLAQRHLITLVTQQEPDVTDRDVEALRSYVTELAVFPRRQTAGAVGGAWGKVSRFSKFLRQGTPPNVLYFYSPEMQAWVDAWVEKNHGAAITSEHSVNEIYIRPQWQQKLKTVVNIHSSVYGTCKQHLDSNTSEKPTRDRLQLPLLRQYEQRYCSKFSEIVVTTDEDCRQLQDLSPQGRFSVIPNGVELEEFSYRHGDPGGHKLIFTGAMDNLPNIDAVRFLSLEVLPLVQTRYPDATLTLVGARPVPQVQELNQLPGVTVTGAVPSVAEYLQASTVCVVPMRSGYGIKNKTLEAMAAGVPVVASDRGLEGLAVDGDNVPLRALRANRVPEYVEAISRLFEDRRLRQSLSRQARTLIETEYTWETAGFRYEQVLSRSV
ncbi:MAG: glycosyltransferase [Oscillatoriaceae cyanobacterium]